MDDTVTGLSRRGSGANSKEALAKRGWADTTSARRKRRNPCTARREGRHNRAKRRFMRMAS